MAVNTENLKRMDGAARQRKHEIEKKKRYVRRQVWVPLSQTDDFAATVKQMQKRWSKLSLI
jgi:hypothetical protein